MRPAAPEVGGGVDEDMIGTGCRSGDRNKVGGDRAILDRGYGYLRRGDRYTLDRWLGPQGGGPGGGVTPPPTVALLNGMVSYWALEDAGGFTTDSKGSNTLSGFGPPASIIGKVGLASYFNGNANYNCLTNSSLNVTGTSFTFSAWVEPTAVPASGGLATILSKWGPGGNEYLLYIYNDATLGPGFYFIVTDSTGANHSVLQSMPIANANWYYVVAWFDNSNGQLHLQVNNGTVFNSGDIGYSMGVGSEQFNLGSMQQAPYYFFTGIIDEVGFWKRTLTVQERTALWNNGFGLPYTRFASPPVHLNDGDPVSAWLDQSNFLDDAANTGAARPTLHKNVLNGKPVVRYASGQQLILPIGLTTDFPWTFFAVMNGTPGQDSFGLYDTTAGATTLQQRNDGYTISGGHTAQGYVTPPGWKGAFHVFTAEFLTNSVPPTIYVDGTAFATTPFLNPVAGLFVILGSGLCDIAEAMHYGQSLEISQLSATERANLEAYLGQKYGIAVTSGGSPISPYQPNLKGWWAADYL